MNSWQPINISNPAYRYDEGMTYTGEITAVADTSTAESNTWVMTQAQWTSYSTEATGVNLSETGADSSIDFSTLAISNNSENDTFFQFF